MLFICVNQFDHLRCRHMERKNKMMKRYLQECPLYHRSNDDDDVDDFILRLNEGDPRFEHLKKLIFNRLSRILVSNTDTNTSAEANGEKDLELDGGLDYFTEKEKGAVACGHVFRKGELVYRCKQCGNDDTCVLCAQCFDPDSHIGHDVSYSISGSGGCCDCGDPEAWKNELNCKVHGKTLLGEIKDEEIDLKESKFAALQDHLTEILKECVEFLAETFLDVFYSHKDEVFVPESDITYAVVLYNDEVHNFDQVNDSLVAAISCSTLEAQKIAEIVDRRGRECVVVEKDFARCMTIAEILREHSGINSPFVSFRERSLEVRIAPRLRVCRENMCHFLLQWLIEICKRNELIRKIVSRVFCLPFTVDEERHKLEPKFGKKPKSALEVLLWTDVSLWKEIRCESRELLIISLLVDGTYRKDLALSFSRLYPKISEDFFNLDREPDLNFVFFSVQLFTAPSLALLVIREDDAVLNILKMLNSNFRLCIDQGVELILSVRFITERRYFHALNDLRYFLQSDGVKPILSKSLDLIQAFLDFISIFQGMDKFSREVDAHVEFESESWIYSFNLSMQISLLITHFANLFEDKESLGAAIGQTIMRIKDTNLSFPYFRESPVFPYLNDESSSTAWKQEFEVGQSEVPMSFHHPLHWFLGQLLKRAAKVFNGDFSFLKSIMVEKDGNLDSILLKIMEPGLRIRALIAQTRAGYWVRNGLGLRSQILNYSYNPMVGSLFSKPSDFMRVLVERFSVNQYFFNEISSQTISDDLIPVYGSCLEDFLLLIIALVTNRSNFLPIQDECLEIETEIIQILFLGPCTHSKLDKQLPSRISDSPKFEETLKRVSDFKFPLKIDDQGTYSLKASYIDKIQPYYHHYNPKDRSAVEEKLKQNSKGRNSQTGNTEAPSNLVIPPTILHEPPVLGKNIDEIIVCDTFMRLISVFLGRTSWGGGPSELSTILDNVIDILLYILLMAAQTMETLNVIPEKLILVLESLLAIHKADVKSDHSSSVEFVLLKFHTIIVKMNDEHLKSWYESNLSELVNVSNKALESVKGAEASSSGLNSPMSEMEKKRLAAKAKQSQALAKMMKAQEQAMNQFKDLEKDELFEDEEDENFDEYENGGACVLPKGRCLCCQDPCIPSKHGAKNESVYGVIAFVEPSYLPRYVNMEREAFSKVCHSLVGDTGDSAREPYDPWNGGSEKRRTFSYDRENFNLHVNTCGHIMHFSCKQNYMESVHLNSMSSSYPNHMSLGEFTCPLCGAISNTLIPVFDMEGVVNVMEREEQLLFPCQENPKSSSDSRKWIGDYIQLTSYRDLIISSHAVNGASSNSNNNNNFTRNLAAAESDASDVGREAAVGPAEMTDVSMPGNPEILSGNARASMFTELFVRALNAQRQSSSAFEQSEEDSTQSSAISKTHPFIGSNLVRMIDDFKLLVMSRANRRSFGETLAGLYASLSIEYSNSSSDDYKRSLDYNSDPNYWFRPYFQTNGCSESSLTLQLNPLQKLVLQMSLDSMRMSDLIANLKTFDDELPISRLSSHKLYEDALDSILTNQWSNTLNLKPNLMSSLCQIIVSLHPKTSNLSQIVPSLCRVVFHANVLQMINAVTMLSISNLKKSSRENTESNAVNANGHPLKTFLRLIPKFAACNFDYEKFESLLTNLTIPILREMALITHSILKIPLPRLEYHDENEWSILGTFTGIGESIGQIFSEWIDVFPLMTEFTFSWISNGDNSMGTPLLRIIKSPFPYELIPLPERFEILFFKRDDHPCSKCGQIPSNPSICLVCGDILCSLSICCSENNVGECNQHVQKCCNPGLFLCIQRCAILLLSGDKRLGAFIHAPYLDAYGETDENLRRGHPLALVRDRYEEIRMNWLQGGITTMIFRKNECHLEVQEKDGSLWTSEKVLPWLRYFIFTGIYLSIGDPLIDFAFKAWLPFYWQLKVFCWLFLAYPIGNRRLSNLYKYSSEHILFPLEPTISKLLRRYLPGWITDISSNDISDQNGLSKKSDSSKKNDSSKKSDSSKKNDSIHNTADSIHNTADSIHNTADSIPLVPFTSLKAPNEPIAPIVIRNRKLQNKPRPIILTSSMKQTKRTSSMVDSGEAAKS